MKFLKFFTVFALFMTLAGNPMFIYAQGQGNGPGGPGNGNPPENPGPQNNPEEPGPTDGNGEEGNGNGEGEQEQQQGEQTPPPVEQREDEQTPPGQAKKVEDEPEDVVRICHFPPGNPDKGQIKEEGFSGHDDHEHDFLIEDEEDEALCLGDQSQDQDPEDPEETQYPYGIITAPDPYEEVDGNTSLTAEYYDGDDEDNDAVQWAVRFETCAANTNTVFGNVDGHSDSFSWDGMYFSSTVDMTGLEPGNYCFVFNPTDDNGEPDVRETRWFTVPEPPTGPQDDFKPGDHMDYDALCLETETAGEYPADEAVYANQGLTNDDEAVKAARSNPDQGLVFETAKSESNFYSLGFGGIFVAKFNTPIINGDGDDVRIIETTWSTYPTETANVYASKNGTDWELLGEVQSENGSGTNINFATDFDLGSLDWAQYIKIIDTSDVDDFDAQDGADGIDINAVLALHVGEYDECTLSCSAVIYGVNDHSELNIIDPITGDVTYLDDISVPSWAVAVDVDSELVYYLSTNGNTLGTYDPETKTNNTVAITGADIANVSRLTIHPDTGLLYAGDQNLKLFTIDTTGFATELGTISGASEGGGDIAFGPDGTLYLVNYNGNSSNIYTVDYSGSPVATLVGDTGLSRPSGIAWYNNSLYISSMTNSDNKVQIYSVSVDDVTSPVAVGEVQNVRNQDLASCVEYEADDQDDDQDDDKDDSDNQDGGGDQDGSGDGDNQDGDSGDDSGDGDTTPTITTTSSDSSTRSSRRRGGSSRGGEVLGASTIGGACEIYLTTYMRMGANNDTEEVTRLQSFLNTQGITTPVTGIFGQATDTSVRTFQSLHQSAVLDPWQALGLGNGTPTGYVYKTTRYTINNIVCPGSEQMPLLP